VNPHSGTVYVVTGGRGAGKTTFCRRLLKEVRALSGGVVAAGVLSPKVREDHQDVAIDVVDVASGRRRRLAERRDPAATRDRLSTKRWQFHADSLSWGNTVLQSATPCDLLVVDELGILEFEGDDGWTGGIAAVDSAAYRAAFVVVRPELLARAQHRWPEAILIHIAHPKEAEAAARRCAAAFAAPLTER